MPGPSCPKRMVFGPCGGVRADGSCEMLPMPCVFPQPVAWSGPAVTGAALRDIPLVLTDLSSAPFDLPGTLTIARTVAATCDAVLLGEHHNRPDFPPAYLAAQLLSAGVQPWVTLACRDRNRVVLEQELRGLLALGVPAVLCVTGDGRGPDVRPDVTQVFDLDGVRLAALAASLGMPAAVPETPTAPPAEQRAFRLLQKQSAGASVAVLNHVGDPARVAHFVEQARSIGVHVPLIAAVAVITDDASARALRGLPGLDLDEAALAPVLAAADPVEAGIASAVAQAQQLLSIDGVDGVNLSGLASGNGWVAAAEIKAETARLIRAATAGRAGTAAAR